MKILIFTPYELKFDGFECVWCNSENEFYEKVINIKFDVLIIDFAYLKEFLEIKDYTSSVVVFITDYCDMQIYKKALEVGDYCYLIYEYEKIKLRLEYLHKKILNSKALVYKNGDILYNFKTDELYVDSKPVKLSQAEKELLKALIKNKNRYLSDEILKECENIESESSIKVLVSHLRKIGIKINNLKNYGYKIKEK